MVQTPRTTQGTARRGLRGVVAWAMARFPDALRAAGLVAVALLAAAVANAFHPLGLRWTPSPDGRVGIPRAYEHRLQERSAAQARRLLRARDVIFVDTRDPKDYRRDHIPGAVNIPMRDWDRQWPKWRNRLPRSATLLLYCYGFHCGLSTRMGKRLLELGYERPVVLRRGWAEWQEAGYPTVRRPRGKE